MRYLSMIGAMTCIYAIGRLLNSLCIRLEDRNIGTGWLQETLTIVYFLLYLLSAPVALFHFFINSQLIKRIQAQHDSEILRLKAEHINELARMRGSLPAQSVSSAEYEAGYHDGYQACYEDTLARVNDSE